MKCIDCGIEYEPDEHFFSFCPHCLLFRQRFLTWEQYQLLLVRLHTIDIIGNKRLSRCAAGGSKVVQATRHHHHRVIKLRFRVAEHIFNNPTPFDPCNHMFDHNAHT